MMNVTSINPPPPSVVDQVVSALQQIADPVQMLGVAQHWAEQHRALSGKATDLDILGSKLDAREKVAAEKESELIAREAGVAASEATAKVTRESAVALLASAETASRAADARAAKVAETAAALADAQRQLAGLIVTPV